MHVTNLFHVVATLALLPSKIAEEAVHAAAALPWAARMGVLVEPRTGRAAVDIEWLGQPPTWALLITHFAPAILGSAIGVVVLAWWATEGFVLPEVWSEWALLSVVTTWWALFTWPGRADREVSADGTAD